MAEFEIGPLGEALRVDGNGRKRVPQGRQVFFVGHGIGSGLYEVELPPLDGLKEAVDRRAVCPVKNRENPRCGAQSPTRGSKGGTPVAQIQTVVGYGRHGAGGPKTRPVA